MLLALSFGLLPWSAGFVVLLTQSLRWITVAGIVVCFVSTGGMYWLRRSHGRAGGAQWLLVEPMLFGCYYAFSAVLMYYVILRR